MEENILKKEFEFYIKNQSDFVKKYDGKFVVLKNNDVLGSYDTQLDAFEKTKKDHEIGSFLIQFVTKGQDSYTQTFYSRVFL